MKLSFQIAKRYLFSKKTHNAINIISMISACGVAVATMALVCTLSVFNGFTEMVTRSFSAFDPDLQITPKEGKVFDPSGTAFDKVRQLGAIELVSESLEENALVKFEDRQVPAIIKGVSPNFDKLTQIEELIIQGEYKTEDGDFQFGVIGAGLAMSIGVNVGFIAPIEIYAPKRDVKVNLANPSNAFARSIVYTSGVFAMNQQKYDDQVLIVSISEARYLFRYEKEVSSLDIKLKNVNSVESTKKEIKQILGDKFHVKDRFEQQADAYRMVNIEKWVTFLILAFILIIAAFNVVGSLSMLILEKSNDIQLLKTMGADNKLIARIFLIEGWMISILGACVGLVVGLILCLAQQYFGILKLGGTPGTFLVDAYPVVVDFGDIFFIFLTVSVIGFITVIYPVNNLRRRLSDSSVSKPQ